MVAAHLPAPAFAQDASAKRDSAVTRLETGQQIRISGEAMSRLIGKAGVASGDTLDFAQDDAVRRIPIQAIDTLWVRGGSSTTGAIIGASIGVLFGMGRSAVSQAQGEGKSTDSFGKTMAGAFLGAFVMGGIGALVGGAVPSWHRTFP
jgi:hypothetical protein